MRTPEFALLSIYTHMNPRNWFKSIKFKNVALIKNVDKLCLQIALSARK